MGGNVAPQTTTFDSTQMEDERAVSRELTNGSDHSGAGADTEPTGDVDISGLETLVLQAFSKAAAQQEPEWFRMRGAVPKNRLLDLTNRTFDETDYGADRFLDVVELLHDMLKVDLEVKPFAVELLELPLGFHWDVSKRDGAKIETPMAVWKVDGHRYINVYADGRVRRGSRDCKRVWNEQQSKSEDEDERRRSRQKF